MRGALLYYSETSLATESQSHLAGEGVRGPGRGRDYDWFHRGCKILLKGGLTGGLDTGGKLRGWMTLVISLLLRLLR